MSENTNIPRWMRADAGIGENKPVTTDERKESLAHIWKRMMFFSMAGSEVRGR